MEHLAHRSSDLTVRDLTRVRTRANACFACILTKESGPVVIPNPDVFVSN